LTIAQAREFMAEQLRNAPIRIVQADGREQRIGLRPNEVGLDIAEFRPIYTSGDVQIVGEVPFTPGLTARQAIVKAGGLRRIEVNNQQFLLNVTNQQVRLQQQSDASLIMLFGLLDEYKILNPDAQTAEIPLLAQVEKLKDDTSQDQDGLAQLRQRLLELEEANRQTLVDQLASRVGVIENLEASSEESVEIAKAAVERLQNLADEGLLRVDAMDSARQNLSQAQSRLLEAAAERLRVKIEISRMESLNEVERLEETQRVFEDIRQEWNRWSTAQAQLKNLNWISSGSTSSEEEATDVRLTLYRTVANSTNQRSIEFDETLAPGDVLSVQTQ